MRRVIIILICLFSCGSQNGYSQQYVTAKKINQIIAQNEKVAIFFWATWCTPSVEALKTSFNLFDDLEKRNYRLIFLANIKSDSEYIKRVFMDYPQYLQNSFILDAQNYFPNNRMKTLDKIRRDICTKCQTIPYKKYKALQTTTLLLFHNSEIAYNNKEYFNKDKVRIFLNE